MLKYIKILKGTPICFDLNRSSSGSRSVLNNLKLFKSLKTQDFKVLKISPGVVAAMRCTTRFTTYTCYIYCCHNTGTDRQDFKILCF